MDVDDNKPLVLQQDEHDDTFYDTGDDPEDGEDFQMRFGRPGGFRGGRGGPPPNWGPLAGPPRFRGRGYGPGGPPLRGGRGGPPFFRGRGGRLPFGPNGPSNGPNYDGWGPMGPPGMMGPGGPNGPGGPGGPPFGPPGMMGGPMGMGPPAQMMGPNSGGHFGPPGMGPPPPMMPELWVETKSEDGKYYFYNACSRETTWTKPEGPNVKIISQSEIEAMNQGPAICGPLVDSQSVTTQQQECKNGDTSPVEASNVNLGGNAPQEKSEDTQVNTPPNVSMNMMGPGGPVMGSNSPMAVIPNGPKMVAGNTSMAPPVVPGPFGGIPPTFGPPPFGMPPPGNWTALGPGQWPGAMPPFMGKPASSLTPISGKGGETASLPNLDPVLVAKAAEWTEHKAPDGRSYYYHAKNAESVWEKPQALKDLEAAKMIQQNAPAVNAPVAVATKPAVVEIQPAKSPKENTTVSSNSKTNEMEIQQATPSTAVEPVVEHKNVPAKKVEEEKKEVIKVQDKSKPVSSTPISGTPWCVVWTGDGRVFFYNPSSRTSVWERPEELSGRADVDKAVSNPPTVMTVAGSNNPKQNDTTKNQPGKREQTDSDDSDSPHSKKLKKEGASTVLASAMDKKQIDIGKEAAIEAEVRAARERAVVPLETRIKSFKEMLQEKEVSAFSTWEKELHKIVFDPRYLLLTSKERKQVFDRYVKDRAEEERREKRTKLKQRKDEFKALLDQAHLHGKSSFSDFAAKYSKDERFKNIEKMRERESLFNEYILDVRKKEKEDKQQKRDQTKKEFFALLREHKEIDRHSRWGDIKKKLENDARYKAVDSSSNREDWFRDYGRILKDERKKEKDNKEKDKEKKDKDRRERKESSSKSDSKKESSKKDPQSSNESGTMPSSLDQNESEASRRERTSSNNTSAGDEEDEKQKEREKQARAEQSIREREKEVQKTLATHMRDRDKEREHHKRDEAVQHFTALLSDLVRNGDTTWREAKRQLRKDHRWDLADLLDREEKERLFESHMEQLTKKKRDKFREMLDELSQVTLTSSWKDVKKLIKDDPRYSKFSSGEKCEREFRDYMKDKLGFAKNALRELLQETKLITHKSLAMVRENSQHLTEIENLLRVDKRYLVLDHLINERTHIIMSYLEELDKRGPPPPPTASEPSRRLK